MLAFATLRVLPNYLKFLKEFIIEKIITKDFATHEFYNPPLIYFLY